MAFGLVATACGGGSATRPNAEDKEPREGGQPLVDPDEIRSGGPPPDGIPPIDEPKFIPAGEVDWLDAREPVITVELNGDARAYPAQILIWHEIVNDVVGGVPVTITYCPLCNTGIGFKRPTIDGELLDFGTSGKLYKSNLVMYDRQTESLWPQVTGQAVVGPLTGTQLEFVPVQIAAWGDWLASNPEGTVLSQDTGAVRPYGSNPYEGYDDPEGRPFLFRDEVDPRLPPMARVVGVRLDHRAMAFPYQELRRRAAGDWAAVRVDVEGTPLAVFWTAGTRSAVDAGQIAESRDVGAVGVFDARLGGEVLSFIATADGIVDEQTGSTWDIFGRAVGGELAGQELGRIVAIDSFWFDWAGFFPETTIFKAEGGDASPAALGEDRAGKAPPTGTDEDGNASIASGPAEVPRRPKL